MRYWIGWYQPITKDVRPLKDPPNEAILGWWFGEERTNKERTICAVVKVKNSEEAKLAIKKDWPEAERWRFCESRNSIWTPEQTRFPIDKRWMRDRLFL